MNVDVDVNVDECAVAGVCLATKKCIELERDVVVLLVSLLRLVEGRSQTLLLVAFPSDSPLMERPRRAPFSVFFSAKKAKAPSEQLNAHLGHRSAGLVLEVSFSHRIAKQNSSSRYRRLVQRLALRLGGECFVGQNLGRLREEEGLSEKKREALAGWSFVASESR